MPVVAVLNEESRLPQIASALSAYGIAVANHHHRPGASALADSLRKVLGPRPDGNQLQCHELPLLIDGDPSWTSVLVLPPSYEYSHGETTALAARALIAAKNAAGKGMFLHYEP
jgi:hypothetical protein